MPDLSDSEILALARAARVDIPTQLVAEVGYSLNGLLEALGNIQESGLVPDLDGVEPLPIVIPPDQTSTGGQ